ncbi:OPT superfamily oligopeptide transporter [Melanomma pulvis-pyrius CBS 109.77]|uniref:OPT superfamily oligopeptide transporter n=1 Tax=Melanomma pulvis-pyrius CBS 109.77 TaxID=1314802 RepID=A0A6A6XRC6_9PLEO|nr:OPT superfamily oligopeptide transporter [Melanomma pulvis-pyrius CBS 109.77]
MAGPARNFTLRAVVVGMLVGLIVNLSNTYYGLVAGASEQMPTVSVLFGYLAFSLSTKFGFAPLTKAETVLLMSTATATGCMTVTAGFAEFIPGIEYVLGPGDGGPMHLTWREMFIWALGLCFFGIVFAALLRKPLVSGPGLPWPGATATATVIKALHASDSKKSSDGLQEQVIADQYRDLEQTLSESRESPHQKLRLIASSAIWSGLLTTAMYFVPVTRNLPIFGRHIAKKWLWALNISPGLFGGGLIVGPVIGLHMMSGAIVGWGILSPYVTNKGWVSGHVSDWKDGSRAWLVWLSLAALTSDAIVKMVWICLQPLWHSYLKVLIHLKMTRPGMGADDHRTIVAYSPLHGGSDSTVPEATISDMTNSNKSRRSVNWNVLGIGFVISIVVCILATDNVFGAKIPWTNVLLAIVLSLPMGVVGIRSLGELDYNPQSGLTVSQLVFASLTPHSNRNAVIINVVSAAIATAGSSQTGDLAYDFKIGEMVGAAPGAQMYGQIIGSIFGCIVSCATYRIYTSNFPIPGPFLQIPTSFIQVRTAELLLGRGLPDGVAPFALAFSMFFSLATIVKMIFKDRWWQNLIPSGVSFALGIWVAPAVTVPRALGGVAAWYLLDVLTIPKATVEVLGSGLIVGESIGTLTYVVFKMWDLPQWGSD